MDNRIAITEDQLFIQNKYETMIQKAVKSWERYNNTSGMYKDNSIYYYNKAEKILQEKYPNNNVKINTGVGLYPTIQFEYSNKQYEVYNTEGFFKRVNGFWD